MEIPYRHNLLRILFFHSFSNYKRFRNSESLSRARINFDHSDIIIIFRVIFEIAFILAMVSNVSTFTTYINGDDIETLF